MILTINISKVHRKVLLVPLALFSLWDFGAASSFAQASRRDRAQTPARPDYTLRISTKDLITISLKAEKIPLSNIAGEISRKIKVPVLLGPSAGKRQLTRLQSTAS